MNAGYDDILACIESEKPAAQDDFLRQLKLARDTAIIRLLRLGLSLREVANLDAEQIVRLPVPGLSGSAHFVEVMRGQPVRFRLDPAAVNSLHRYLMLRGSQKRRIFLRVRKQTPISHTDIAMLLSDIRQGLAGKTHDEKREVAK